MSNMTPFLDLSPKLCHLFSTQIWISDEAQKKNQFVGRHGLQSTLFRVVQLCPQPQFSTRLTSHSAHFEGHEDGCYSADDAQTCHQED